MNEQQEGYTYIIVLVSVLVVSILSSAASVQMSYLFKQEKEKELLFRGKAYAEAIKSYYYADGVAHSYPMNLSDLLQDPRFPNKKHLRQLYPNPMAQSTQEWVLIYTSEGAISGVRCDSKEQPLKQVDFSPAFHHFEDAKSYAEWFFLLPLNSYIIK